MKRRVIWSPASQAEVVRIARDISFDNPRAAKSVAARLRTAGEALGDAAIGRPGRVEGTYEKVLPGLPYIIAYELIRQDVGEVVAILHVIHTRRHWPAGAWPQED